MGDDTPSVRSLTFDSEEGAYVAEFDDGNVSPSTAIISVIAEITDQSAMDLQPLYYEVDPDALNRIARDCPSGEGHSKRSVNFAYLDFTIRLLSSGVIKVYPSSSQRDTGESDQYDG